MTDNEQKKRGNKGRSKCIERRNNVFALINDCGKVCDWFVGKMARTPN